jgi:hypothetical protein
MWIVWKMPTDGFPKMFAAKPHGVTRTHLSGFSPVSHRFRLVTGFLSAFCFTKGSQTVTNAPEKCVFTFVPKIFAFPLA